MDTRTFLFMGLPASGKGTQAKLLAQELGCSWISAGGLYRSLMQEDSLLGNKLNEVISKGRLAPAWTAMYLFEDAIFKLKAHESIVLDGFGRKYSEAEIVDEVFTWFDRPYTVFNLKVSPETFKERSQGRLKKEGRADDKYLDTRLREYEEHTARSIEFFREKGHVIDIDGEQDPENVHMDIMTAVKNRYGND